MFFSRNISEIKEKLLSGEHVNFVHEHVEIITEQQSHGNDIDGSFDSDELVHNNSVELSQVEQQQSHSNGTNELFDSDKIVRNESVSQVLGPTGSSMMQTFFDDENSSKNGFCTVEPSTSKNETNHLAGHALRPKNVSIEGKIFILPASFWEKYWTGNIRLKANWTDSFNDCFKATYPYCVLSFKRHVCLPDTDDKNAYVNKVLFRADAKCLHSSCTSYKFWVTNTSIYPFRDMVVHVYQSSEYCHESKETHRRFVKGDRRRKLAEDLRADAPSIKKFKMLADVSDDILASGNLNESLDRTILEKISSENNVRHDLDKDNTIFMWKLIDEFKDKWLGTVFSGYIQLFSEKPVYYILLMAETVLRHVLLPRYRPLFLYLDATGSIIKNPPHIKSQIFNYALVLPGGQDYSPLSVIDFISSEHGVKDVSTFLINLNDRLCRLTTRRPVIDTIGTDFRLCLFQSVSLSFNGMKLNIYLQQIYKELIQVGQESAVTIIHICSSHFIKTVLKKIDETIDDDDMKVLAACAITKLIHSTSLDEASNILKRVFAIFGTQKRPRNFNQCMKYFETVTKCEDDEDDIDDDTRHQRIIIDEEQQVHDDTRKDSPFFKLFSHIKDSVLKESDYFNKQNIFYSEAFIKYLLEFLLPYYPLWSGVLIQKFGLTRDTNAPVENYWKIEKHTNLEGKKRILAPRYIQKKESFQLQKVREREFTLKTTRTIKNREEKKKRVKKNKLTESNKKRNIYFKGSRFLSKERQEKRRKKKLLEEWKSSTKKAEINEDDESERFPEESWKKGNNSKNLNFQISKYITKKKSKKQVVKKREAKSNKKVKKAKDSEKKEMIKELMIDEVKVVKSEDEDIKNGNEVMENENEDVENHLKDTFHYEIVANDFNDTIRDEGNLIFTVHNIFLEQKEYPPLFPNGKICVDGVNINNIGMKTLNPNQWLDDSIINAFFFLLQNHCTTLRAFSFDTFFVESLMSSEFLSDMWKKWATSVNIWDQDVWLMPVNHASHWSLLVVVPKYKMFLYLDSLHLVPPKNLIENVCLFMEMFSGNKFTRKVKGISWPQWTLYMPNDVPLQTTVPNSCGNCGVHVCSWAYTIFTGKLYEFHERDMNNVRKNLAHIFYTFYDLKCNEKRKFIRNRVVNNLFNETMACRTLEIDQIKIKKNLPIMTFDSTIEFCSSLNLIFQ